MTKQIGISDELYARMKVLKANLSFDSYLTTLLTTTDVIVAVKEAVREAMLTNPVKPPVTPIVTPAIVQSLVEAATGQTKPWSETTPETKTYVPDYSMRPPREKKNNCKCVNCLNGSHKLCTAPDLCACDLGLNL